jgi:hypothetical protein
MLRYFDWLPALQRTSCVHQTVVLLGLKIDVGICQLTRRNIPQVLNLQTKHIAKM